MTISCPAPATMQLESLIDRQARDVDLSTGPRGQARAHRPSLPTPPVCLTLPYIELENVRSGVVARHIQIHLGSDNFVKIEDGGEHAAVYKDISDRSTEQGWQVQLTPLCLVVVPPVLCPEDRRSWNRQRSQCPPGLQCQDRHLPGGPTTSNRASDRHSGRSRPAASPCAVRTGWH
jgi:hypothetical protein